MSCDGGRNGDNTNEPATLHWHCNQQGMWGARCRTCRRENRLRVAAAEAPAAVRLPAGRFASKQRGARGAWIDWQKAGEKTRFTKNYHKTVNKKATRAPVQQLPFKYYSWYTADDGCGEWSFQFDNAPLPHVHFTFKTHHGEQTKQRQSKRGRQATAQRSSTHRRLRSAPRVLARVSSRREAAGGCFPESI